MYNNLYDLHSHSIYSFDGNHTCDDMVNAAIQKKLKGIAITDHFDIGEEYEQYEPFDDEKQFNDVIKCKQKYNNIINVYAGIEIGQGIHDKKRCEALINRHSYDFILGSVHNIRNTSDFYYLEYNGDNVGVLLNKYFDELIELAEWGQFDSLAHLTYPVRYITGKYGINVDLSIYQDKIDAVLEILIKKNKALEINTSGLFMEINDTLPPAPIIKRYRKMGGKYITIGSDSHYANKVCQGIEQGMCIAKECGFDYITIFEKRQPRLITIQ
ncbi:MAG: histidinol-phosphatase HisJ family protein [Clostridiales bacterium]|nr:histidinol-phosphatase HisJ family protein [Clostridiales bacterium]